MEKVTQFKPLPDQFIGRGEVRGYRFTKLGSPNGTFIYEVSNNGVTYYEGFFKRVNSRYGNVTYPSSKAFGKWAWWSKDYQELVDRLKSELKNREKGKEND